MPANPVLPGAVALNIVLLGHDDIASLYALDRLARGLDEHRIDVRLSGPLTSSQPAAEALVRLAGIDRDLCRRFLQSAHPALADAQILPQPNAPDGLAALQALAPDLIVSVRYRRILKNAAIAIPRRGVLNLHSGLLPAYKGVMATFWAMLNDESEIGCTLHWIVDAGIDTGPVIGESRIPRQPGSSYLANVLALYGTGCDMILSAINAIARGDALPANAQDPAAGHYYSTPDGAAIERFEAKGLVLAEGSELDALLPRKKLLREKSAD